MKKAKLWFENYWYHYKWLTIVVVFFAVALAVCLTQCTNKNKYDMYTLYAGPLYIGAEESKQLTDAVNDHMQSDRQSVCVNSFVYVSEELKEKYEQDDAYYNAGINMQQTSDFFDFLYTASFNMLILDSELYSLIEKEELITPIAEISDIAAQSSPDGYCIPLASTSLADKYSIFAEMPEDTVLCFRENVLMQSLASNRNSDEYEFQLSVFKKLIES